MSATAVVPTPSFRNDLAAGARHCATCLRLTAREPLALGTIVFVGVLTVPAWSLGLVTGLLQVVAIAPGTWTTISAVMTVLVLFQLLAAVAVGAAVAGRVGPSPSGIGPVIPALPVGGRTRLLAEALAALAVLLASRLAFLAMASDWLPGVRIGYWGHWWSLRQATDPLAWTTAAGALLFFPAVLAWMATVRRHGGGVARMLLVMALLAVATLAGAMGRPWSALLVSLLLSALALVRPHPGDSDGTPQGRAARLLWRPSPGPLARLRRDAWTGPLRLLWFYALVVPGPIALAFLQPRRFPLVFVAQLCALAVPPLFPFGLRLAAPGGALFRGRFLEAWATLPVPSERVSRAVYLHALLTAGLVPAVFCVYAVALADGYWLPLFFLPAVVLGAGIVLCQAAGDRRRGMLALGCLVGHVFVSPVAVMAANLRFDLSRSAGALILVAAYLLGVVGGVPPLVHLRRRATTPASSS